jgi:hypothetical protein
MNAPKPSATSPPTLCHIVQSLDELTLLDEMALAVYHAHIHACPVCRDIYYPLRTDDNFSG